MPIKNKSNIQEEAMIHLKHLLARRSLIKGAGLGLVAGALADTVPARSEGP